ncbi:malectin domain-containing carbohydrate-binding protein [Arsenicicoccus dermatophilus]|uniref:malectin domain-containing carbohydrate-binding protein n=1 Tax=Arsenicicoccus dermatophilus TaxID=1076331 RepID=UPI002409017D|nr:malectin domain-containing carbohydrate-binding protein [Arsenicicoccus dermatophilus]
MRLRLRPLHRRPRDRAPGARRSTALGRLGMVLTAGLAVASSSPLPTAAAAVTAAPEPFPTRLFAPDSFWYRRLPTTTPTDANSATIAKNIYDQSIEFYGKPGEPAIGVNTTQYSSPLYVARNSDPVTSFSWDNCQGKTYGDTGLISGHLSNLHIPDRAIPAEGTDQEMTIYNADTGELTETWITKKTNGRWTACWGGTIRGAASSNGVFPAPFGTTASGLSFAGGTIRASELAAGHIDHVVGIALPNIAPWPTISTPANRTDGYNPTGRPVAAQGQMLRIPANVNLDAMKLSPTARTIAKAAQEYGLIVWDTAGSVSFRAENPLALATNPYPTLFRGRADWQEMLGDPTKGERAFPLELLQVLPMNYSAPETTTPGPQPDTAGTPTAREAMAWSSFLDETGRAWEPRHHVDTTTTSTELTGKDVLGTTSDSVYRTQAFDVRSYSRPVPDGTYTVRLYQAEDYYTAAGQRVFDVTAEGRVVASQVDLVARTGGRYRAYEPTFTVTVTDGRLDLGFVPRVGGAVLAGVEIVSGPPSVAPLHPVSAPTTRPKPVLRPRLAPRSTR